MFKTTDTYLDQQNSVWKGMALFVTADQKLKEMLAAIDAAAQKQETPSTGVTLDKAAARDALEDVMFLMCEALGVVGHTANDNNLVALTDLTPSNLDQMDVEELANRATNVLAEVNARANDLATMNVTQANIEEFSHALQNYKAAKERPRTAAAEKAAQTESLASLIRNLSAHLRNQMDPLVNLFRRTNADFVAGYKSARVIVDRAATHKTKPTNPPSNSNSGDVTPKTS
jgi:hypothetical protein